MILYLVAPLSFYEKVFFKKVRALSFDRACALYNNLNVFFFLQTNTVKIIKISFIN